MNFTRFRTPSLSCLSSQSLWYSVTGEVSLLPCPRPSRFAVAYSPVARFSKVPRTFRARKAIRKTTTCLFCKASLFICCKGNKNKNNCKVSCLKTPSFRRYKENYVTRKVSGLSRNRPQDENDDEYEICLLYTSPSPRDA